jgi:hypothetical protein
LGNPGDATLGPFRQRDLAKAATGAPQGKAAIAHGAFDEFGQTGPGDHGRSRARSFPHASDDAETSDLYDDPMS